VAHVNITTLGAEVQAPPITEDLQRFFNRLDDIPLMQALTGSSRRGPKGYHVYTLWRCFLVKHYLSLPSTEAMRRTLHNNPFIARACGISSPEDIPHHSTFSRFFKLLADVRYLHLVKDVSRRLVRHHYQTLPAFGERVAMDSTTLKGWSNGGKNPKFDKQAGWSVKKGSQGVKEATYGYKLHLLVDCESELPISANVSAGNVNDAKRASNLLSEARFTTGYFHPRYVMADKGYSGKPLYRLIRWQYHAQPIIDPNPGHKKLVAEVAEMKKTTGWQALYKQRPAVERAYSRLKGQRSLNHITVRGLRKVTVHCYLSLIAMQASTRH